MIRAGEKKAVNESYSGLKPSAREAVEGYLFLLPNLLGFLIFFAYPLIKSFYYSFTDFNLFTEPNWVGLQNYMKALGFSINTEAYQQAMAQGKTFIQSLSYLIVPNDPTFWTALGNTIV